MNGSNRQQASGTSRRALGAALVVTLIAWATPALATTDVAVLRQSVERAAAEAARHLVAAPDRLELEAVRFGGADPLPAGPYELDLLESDGPNESGIARLRFRVLVDGMPRGEARATVRGTVHGPVVTARRGLLGGQAIDPADVERIDGDLTRLRGTPVRDVESLAGRVPVRTLGSGRALTDVLLRPEPVVRRGDVVDLTIRRSRLTVTAKGTVVRDGAAGEIVPADNLATGARVMGRVQPDGSLQGRSRRVPHGDARGETTMRLVAVVTMLLTLGATGCGVIKKPSHPKLETDAAELYAQLDVLPAFPEPAPASGSLWTDGGPGAALARDLRAFRTNDLVTVVLNERSSGTNESNTDLNRLSENDIGASVAFGLEDAQPATGSFNFNQVLQSKAETTFEGDGTTSRGNRLSGRITARVMRVLPNGDLIVAGQKTVMVNREQQILTLVGSLRPVDIGPDNQVSSSSLGDLTVRLWGQGEIDSTIRQGWFMKIMNRVWPF